MNCPLVCYHLVASPHPTLALKGVTQRVLIQPLRPTDLVPYLAFRRLPPIGEALGNPIDAAVAPDQRATGLAALGALTSSALAFATHRESQTLRIGRAIVGLAVAHPRFGTDTWDVAQLLVAPTLDTSSACFALLEALCQRATTEGIEKLYLRIREGSEAASGARQAGLFTYAQEHVCIWSGGEAPATEIPWTDVAIAGLRPRHPSDHQALFQLYSSAVPLAVRQVEAMTLREWRWLDGWNAPAAWARPERQRRDFVVAREGAVLGWLRVCPVGRQLEVVAGRDAALGRALIAYGVHQLGSVGPVTLVLRDYQKALLLIAEELGFTALARNWLLVRVFTIRATDSLLVPVGAS